MFLFTNNNTESGELLNGSKNSEEVEHDVFGWVVGNGMEFLASEHAIGKIGLLKVSFESRPSGNSRVTVLHEVLILLRNIGEEVGNDLAIQGSLIGSRGIGPQAFNYPEGIQAKEKHPESFLPFGPVRSIQLL
jgi:hypothetical protein